MIKIIWIDETQFIYTKWGSDPISQIFFKWQPRLCCISSGGGDYWNDDDCSYNIPFLSPTDNPTT